VCVCVWERETVIVKTLEKGGPKREKSVFLLLVFYFFCSGERNITTVGWGEEGRSQWWNGWKESLWGKGWVGPGAQVKEEEKPGPHHVSLSFTAVTNSFATSLGWDLSNSEFWWQQDGHADVTHSSQNGFVVYPWFPYSLLPQSFSFDSTYHHSLLSRRVSLSRKTFWVGPYYFCTYWA
jgi:hypothetical protein